MISMRNKGTKNATRCAAEAPEILVITMRSNGNSKIIGAARAPILSSWPAAAGVGGFRGSGAGRDWRE
jgi:hypothetical protein